MKNILLFSFLIILFTACSTSEKIVTKYVSDCIYYEIPTDLRDETQTEKSIEYYKPGLTGKKIFIDPGHGGSDRRNKSENGVVVEADVNLRVSLYLRDFLTRAGAVVIMSRDKDETVDLKYRSELANESGADLFISVHHNSPGKVGDNWTNYTSTFYHAKEGYYQYEPGEHDIAKFVQRDLAYAMRNPGGLGSFDGTYSDFWIYPGDGFSVLRKTEIPAILIECGFHSNRVEEIRLADEQFNKIQAWGIFKGLGKYFRLGSPTITLLQEKSKFVNRNLELNFLLEDKNGIDPLSISAYFDSVLVSNTFIEDQNLVKLNIENVNSGEHEVRIIAANKQNIHSLPYKRKIILK
ncbi:MAG: hypothetical protein CMF23_02965 [Ignavibacteriae bacterium]|nr:hypothetical protein [Ignavibacteriota bacterium]